MSLFKWTAEIEVSDVWVADGLDLTAERLHAILLRTLDYMRSNEITCRILAAPDPDHVALAMGYADHADRMRRTRRFEHPVVKAPHHTQDSDCTLDAAMLCTVCGVDHSATCPACGGHGFHQTTCSEAQS